MLSKPYMKCFLSGKMLIPKAENLIFPYLMFTNLMHIHLGAIMTAAEPASGKARIRAASGGPLPNLICLACKRPYRYRARLMTIQIQTKAGTWRLLFRGKVFNYWLTEE